MLSWKIFKHYLLSRRSGSLIRTIAWMSVLAITIGVASLIIVTGVMNGFNKVIYQRHLMVEPHLVVYHHGSAESRQEWMAKTKKKIEELFPHELEEVNDFETQDIVLKTFDGYFTGAFARSLGTQALQSWIRRVEKKKQDSNFKEIESTNGEEQSGFYSDENLEANEIILGRELADSLRIIEGDKVIIVTPEALLLPVGEAPPLITVVVKKIITSQIGDLDGRLVLFDRKGDLVQLKRTASLRAGLEVRLINGSAYEEPQRILQNMGYQVESWPERNGAIFFALKMEKAAMTVFLSLSAIITSFSILTVLILLVTQKRQDIGILMSMGLNPQRTQWLFTQVGLWLSSLGLFSGLFLGVVVCWIIDRFPLDILPSIYYDRTIPAQVSPYMVLGITIIAVVIALLSSWFPARSCAAQSPAESLRDKI
ncbi:MAG: FtsX-like permease family protein [Bdellovibrionales bacterium]|nr:FtsX-like permease family protein [Bdellovibrionales bacterium]